jgi:hypothetical protein
MPLPLARLQVHRDDAFAEEARAWAVAAVVVARRQLHGQVDATEVFIHRHLRPHTGVARVGPRLALPRVVAEFTELRDGVEDPEALAGPHVESADVALLVLPALW